MTEIRIEHFGRLLSALRRFPRSRVREDRLVVALFPGIGGPIGDICQLVDIAELSGWISRRSGHVVLTKGGRKVAMQDADAAGRLLAKDLIDTGLLADQARALIEKGSVGADGALVCPRRLAVTYAPQLTSLLRRWPAVTLDARLHIPPSLVRQISSLWALLPHEDLEGTRDSSRLAVGERAELYSYKLCIESSAGDSDVDWVSRRDSDVGYDIEDLGAAPSRLIEVKGSRGSGVRFLLSPKEFRVAHQNPDRYEIQYWGGLSLDRRRDQEYKLLRDQGYPIVYRDLRGAIGSSSLAAYPETWEFRG